MKCMKVTRQSKTHSRRENNAQIAVLIAIQAKLEDNSFKIA